MAKEQSLQDSQQELSRLLQDRLEKEKKNILQEKEVRSCIVEGAVD
jgi:hypothetical protein